MYVNLRTDIPKLFGKKEQSYRTYTTQFQNLLQSYRNQDSIILAQGQTYRSMEQNRKARTDPHMCKNLIFNKVEGNSIENATLVSWYPFGKKLTSNQIQKNTTSKCKTQNYKDSLKKHSTVSLWLWGIQRFLRSRTQKAQTNTKKLVRQTSSKLKTTAQQTPC